MKGMKGEMATCLFFISKVWAYRRCCLHPWFHQWCHQAASAAGSPGDWKAWSQCPLTGALSGEERRGITLTAFIPHYCHVITCIKSSSLREAGSVRRERERLFIFPTTRPGGPNINPSPPVQSGAHKNNEIIIDRCYMIVGAAQA